MGHLWAISTEASFEGHHVTIGATCHGVGAESVPANMFVESIPFRDRDVCFLSFHFFLEGSEPDDCIHGSQKEPFCYSNLQSIPEHAQSIFS